VSLRASESTQVPTIGLGSPPVRRRLQDLLFGPTGSLLQQFSRYLVVGGVAFVVDFGLLYLLTEFAGLHYLISAAIAFLFGLLTNYWLSRHWVFNRRTLHNAAMEFVVFAGIGIVGLGLNEAVLWFAQEKIHIHYMIAKVISAGIILVWNFGARKSALFR
jgi:putative flippase GtrA